MNRLKTTAAPAATLFTLLLAAVLAALLLGLAFTQTGCKTNDANLGVISSSEDTLVDLGDAPYGPYLDKDGTWAIYWYLCGSDIELRDNIDFTATGQIMEMMKVPLPPNVTVVIETGGAQRWHNNYSDPNAITRFVYQGDTLTVADVQPLANMGEAETLADFLTYCNTNYPAEKQVLEIADHGGGSLYGIAFDHLFNMDSLSLQEVGQAMHSRPAASGAYELVSFSACLMSSIDTIATLNGLTRYYVASEEVQLGCFWDYEAFFAEIANDTTINGAQLGKAIANGYAQQCEHFGYTCYTTFSVIDMAQADNLITAYNNVGIELLQGAGANGAEGLAAYGRAAYDSENYGANNGPSSSVDMVDLGQLVTKAAALLPNTSAAMLAAIDNAVIYHVTNPQRALGHGVSCYFPYTGSMQGFDTFAQLNVSPAFVYYYEYAMTGSLSDKGQAYLASLTAPEPQGEPTEPTLPPLPAPSSLGLDNHALSPHGNGTWWLELGDSVAQVAAIFLQVGVYESSTGDYILYGTRDDLYPDWEDGMFFDMFSSWWGSIDGALCYMEAISKGDDFVLYRVPVYHNGVPRDLMVLNSWKTSKFEDSTYEILGLITQDNRVNGALCPEYEPLKIGDVVEPMLYRLSAKSGWTEQISGPGEPLTHAVTVTKNTSFYEINLGDGNYVVEFQIIDFSGTAHFSKPGYYLIEDGIFYTVTPEGLGGPAAL